ncbi:MAG: hypothetical protein KIT84_32145 [Labilithrix sp.]|nr:hypothetical protein [Labilithrix sp.]
MLEAHRRIEPGVVGAIVGGRVVTTCDLVGEEHEQEILKPHLLSVGKDESLGQALRDPSEAKALQRVDELGIERGDRAHPFTSFLLEPRVSKCSTGRTKRGSGSCTTRPPASGRTGFEAAFNIFATRLTLMTSKASALWQTASTRPSPYFSQSAMSAYA